MTVENFVRAETDKYFDLFVKQQDALGRFNHSRDLPLEEPGVRPNRDTLYSLAVFDLDAGSVTISLPDAGDRFRSMMVMDEDHYVTQVIYDPGDYTYGREQIGTRYLFVAVRTLVDPADPHDLDQAHALQDAITVRQDIGDASRFLPGIRSATRPSGMLFSCSARRCPTCAEHSVPETKSIPCAT